MKKLLSLSALLIFACSNDLFAQDYMEMRKKQLRIEYQKKIDLINTLTKNQDSLSSSNVKLESNLLTLKNYLKKINDSIVRLKSKNENLNSILIENEEKTSNLVREIYYLKDSVLELKKIIELNTQSVEHEIQFPEFLIGKKINPYFCDELDNEGDILFYKRGPSTYITGDHWGGAIAIVTFIEAEKKIKINYSVSSEDELIGNDTLIIQFGNNGEVLLNGKANKQLICDKTGSLSSYIFDEKDFIRIN